MAVAGRIVYIRLRNFMAYDDIELRPGPRLNLIIGPNGSGKSTFVCAVVVGLGGKLRLLGRGDKLNAFIKSGCDKSTIHIELCDSDEENVSVTRKIYSNNHSNFKINNVSVTATKVHELRIKYNIHLDNLCSFLPQEKVQDFSLLNPQQLLEQTQKVVGTEEMIAAFDELKNIQNTLKGQETTNADLERTIISEKQKNESLKMKVKTYYEKLALCDKMRLINQKKMWLHYHDELSKMKSILKDFHLAEQNLKKRKKEHAKLVKESTLISDRALKAEALYSKYRQKFAKNKSHMRDCLNKIQEKILFLTNYENKIQSTMAEENVKKEECKHCEESLDKLNNDLISFESLNGTDSEMKAKEVNTEGKLQHCMKEELKVIELKSSLKLDLDKVKMEQNDLTREIRLLDRSNYFRLDYIKRCEPDVFKSMEWLKQNRHMFQGCIYNPMMLEIDVTDSKMAKYVEGRINYRDLIAFTCTHTDDMILLIKKLRTEQKLQINVVCSEEDDLSEFKPKIPLNVIRSFGFFSYLKDLITGPNHIIHYLCRIYNIHCIPVGSDAVRSKCETVPSLISVFFSENHIFTVKTSEYSKAKSINVKQLKEPKFLCNRTEKSKIKEMEQRLNELTSNAEMIEMKLKLANDNFKSNAKKIEDLNREMRRIADLREEKQHILMKIRHNKEKIQSLKSSIRDPAQILQEAEAEKKNLKKEISEQFGNLAEICEDLEKNSRMIHEQETVCQILKTKLSEMDALKSTSNDRLTESEETFKNVKAIYEEAENKCEVAKKSAKELTDGYSPGEQGFKVYEVKFQNLKDTVEELQKELQETQVLCDFLSGVDAGIVEDYEKREKDITRMETLLKQGKDKLNEILMNVDCLRETWLSPLKQIVEDINENFGTFFKNMNCGGEITLISGKNENDFTEYGIAIKVKFRLDLPLEFLGRHLQSGGERTLATAVYLLSLQKLISAPFRFVDEINQGMDPINEHKIMDLLVKVTSDVNSGQYFFITPKLLPNITCPETVSVHCIYTGQNINSTNWNLENFLSGCNSFSF